MAQSIGSVDPSPTFTPSAEHHPLLKPSKGKARQSDHESALPGRPIFRTASTSTFGDERVSVAGFADALAVEIHRRDPNPVMQTSAETSTVSPTSTPHGLLHHHAPDTYTPLFHAHWDSIAKAFPQGSSPPVDTSTMPFTPSVPAHPHAPVDTSLSSSPKSAAFLLCATLTLLERSTVHYDPPFCGEMGVEMAIRSRAVREKVQQRLVDLAVNILNDPMDGQQVVPSPTTADQEQDESVTVFWSEWTVSALDPRSECGM